MRSTGGRSPVDVLVVGSGGAGLIAALCVRKEGADVLVVEKSARIGGTAAIGGGALWILATKE